MISTWKYPYRPPIGARLPRWLRRAVLLACLLLSSTHAAAADGAVAVQQRTLDLLDRVDTFSSALAENRRSLFSDRNPANLAARVKEYQAAEKLSKDLDANISEWRILVGQNRNDKVNWVYSATVQLAAYTLYARADELLAILKLREVAGHKELPAFDEQRDMWRERARRMLAQSEEAVARALRIDPHFSDARVVQAELQAVRGDVQDARKAFDALDEEVALKQQGAFLDSWKGYLASASHDRAAADRSLTAASAFAEPARNADWSLGYRRALGSWHLLKFVSFENEGDHFQRLQETTLSTIAALQKELRGPLDRDAGLPIPLPAPDDLAELAQQRRGILLSLDDDSDANLSRFTELLLRVHAHGERLEEAMASWNKLALRGREGAFYYIASKARCGMALLHAMNTIAPLLHNPDIQERLQSRRAGRDGGAGSILAAFARWKATTAADIPGMLAQISRDQPDYPALKLLRFEHEAMFGDAAAALRSLDLLAPALTHQSLEVVGKSDAIDARTYVAAWRSYLLARAGKLGEAGKLVSEVRELRGLEDWADDQEKLLRLRRATGPDGGAK